MATNAAKHPRQSRTCARPSARWRSLPRPNPSAPPNPGLAHNALDSGWRCNPRQSNTPTSTPRSHTSPKHSATSTYESLAHKGETMTTAAMVTYAYDQIDQARAELNAASK